MAIDINNARFLIALKRNGVDFGHVATIGRQGLFIPTKLIPDLFKEGNVTPVKQIDPGEREFIEFSEPFFEQLGCRDITMIDFSDYEGATVTHDMNTPIPSMMKEQYKLLIDSGSIEHMFNVPQAIHNYMQMVKTGGYLVLVNMPVNNHAGHGFYQFSPELFFNLFTSANGFELKSLFVAADAPFSKFYSVSRPEEVNTRIQLFGSESVMLFLVARKVANVERITTPVQHDYSVAWKKSRTPKPVVASKSVKQRVTDIVKKISLRRYFVFSITRNEKAMRKRYALTDGKIYSEVAIERWNMDQ